MGLSTILNLSIDVNRFESYFKKSFKVPVNIFEYRTLDGYYCNVNFLVVEKADCPEHVQAFVALLNHHLHFFQEWDMNESKNNQEYMKNIIHKWLIPEFNPFCISNHEAAAEIQDLSVNIIDKINRKLQSKNIIDIERWGFFQNDQRIDQPLDLALPEGEFSIATIFKCNDMEIYYETKDAYILFSWGTGA